MVENGRRGQAVRSAGIRGLVDRALSVPAWVDRRIAPLAEGIQSVTGGRRRQTEAAEAGAYQAIAGTRVGRGRIATSVVGRDLRILHYVDRRVIGWASVPLADGVARAAVVADPVGLGMALEESFKRFRLPRRHVVGSVSALHASASLFELPWVRDDELAEVVSAEASRALGVSPDDSYLFWQRVPGRRRERLVYVVALPRDEVLSTIEAYETGRLGLDALDLKPLALARAVNQRDAIVVNLESDCLDVVVVVDDLPILFRGFSLPSVTVLGESAYDRVADEVARALSDCEAVAPSHLVEPRVAIYLTGNVAGNLALAERLRARTGHGIGRIVPPLHYPPDFPLAEQMVNVGLALKGT